MIDMAEGLIVGGVDGHLIVGCITFGIFILMLLGMFYVQSDMMASHTTFCDSKYGVGNWTDVVDQCSMACSYKCVPITHKGD
jgi:hypothetical protein